MVGQANSPRRGWGAPAPSVSFSFRKSEVYESSMSHSYLMLVRVTFLIGFHCVPVMLTNICFCGATTFVVGGGAPVPLYQWKSLPFGES